MTSHLIHHNDFDSQVNTVLYPDCSQYKSCLEKRDQNATAANASFPNLVYVRAAAGDDILHFVFSTIHLPSVLTIHTTGSLDTKLNFSWDHLLLADNLTDMAGAINVTGGGDIKYSFTLVFSRVGRKRRWNLI